MLSYHQKRKNYRNDKTECWPTSINEGLNWLPFFDIMEFTADRINNYKILLRSLLNMFSRFKIRCWYNQGGDDQNTVENIAIRVSNCKELKMISMDKMNTTYQDIITSFVLNTMLHHVGMLWIIGTNKQLEYDMDKLYHATPV